MSTLSCSLFIMCFVSHFCVSSGDFCVQNGPQAKGWSTAPVPKHKAVIYSMKEIICWISFFKAWVIAPLSMRSMLVNQKYYASSKERGNLQSAYEAAQYPWFPLPRPWVQQTLDCAVLRCLKKSVYTWTCPVQTYVVQGPTVVRRSYILNLYF